MLNLNINEELEKRKMRSYDRILEIEPIEGVKPQTTSGAIDSRLFKGGNKLHAVLNDDNSLWHLRYEAGVVPESIRQNYTTFSILLNTVTNYFERRGFRIKEVID